MFNILSSELFTSPVFNHKMWYKLPLQSFHNQHHSGNSTSKDFYGSEWKSWIRTMRCYKWSVRNSSPSAELSTLIAELAPLQHLALAAAGILKLNQQFWGARTQLFCTQASLQMLHYLYTLRGSGCLSYSPIPIINMVHWRYEIHNKIKWSVF